jgi:DNA/RNA-binding domain of Phe-tRNA-synthetase-like protein
VSETASVELPVRDGKVSAVLREEFPGLALRYGVVAAKPGRSPQGVRQHLRYLSDRMHGRKALGLRREPIVSAYRVFYRQIGLDPDEFKTPIEAAVLERLRAGGFKSQGLVDDALTIGTVETGVALRALDAERVNGVLALRLAQPGERLGGKRDGLELPSGALVLTDDTAALGLIFGETAADWEVGPGTERIAICAIRVQGVPDISIEEAIWSCAGVLQNTKPPA